MSQSALLAAAVLCLITSLGCWLFYFTLYWPYRALFNEDGRFIDEATMVVYHQQSGVLLLPALAFLLLAVIAGTSWLRRRRVHSVPESL